MKQVPLRYLHLASALLGLMVFSVGICLLIAPELAPMLFGFPTAGDPVWQRETAVRELCLGAAFLVFVWAKDTRALGYLMLICAPIPVADFILASMHGGVKSALHHLPGGPGMIAMGILLLKKV